MSSALVQPPEILSPTLATKSQLLQRIKSWESTRIEFVLNRWQRRELRAVSYGLVFSIYEYDL